MTWSCGVIHLIIAELHCFQHWPQACHPQSSQRWLHKQTQAMVNQGNEDLVGCSPDGSSHCRPYSKACHRASSPRHSQNWLWATVNQVSVDQAESFQGDSWHCRRHSWEYHLEGNQHRFHTPNQQMHRAGRRSWSHCCISLVHQSHLIGRSQQQYPPGQWDSTIKMTQQTKELISDMGCRTWTRSMPYSTYRNNMWWIPPSLQNDVQLADSTESSPVRNSCWNQWPPYIYTLQSFCRIKSSVLKSGSFLSKPRAK